MRPILLSFGGGINSTALLLEWVEQGKPLDLVIFADTGSEMPETYEFIDKYVIPFCKKHKIHFETVYYTVSNKVAGVKKGHWVEGERVSIYDYYEYQKAVPSMIKRSCTDKFKISPIEKYIKQKWGDKNLPLRLIGIDAGESHRAKFIVDPKTGKKINVVAVSARSINKKRKFKVNKKIFYKNPLEIFKKNNIDILFEAIGLSDGISKKVVETALKSKIHVITPNKALISKHGNELAKLAEKNKVNLEFEASVAGGIPILRSIKEGLATNKISKVYGILNGTSNYILSEMENSNENFADVLKKAQILGYAEPGNPKLDLNGFDAFAKVRILSALAFNSKISKHKCLMEGIEKIELKDIKIANQLDLRIKLLGISELKNNHLFETVHPCLVSKKSYIGNVNGVMNAVILQGKPVGESVLQGEGAGPGPTSSSLLSDLLSILRGNIKKPFGVSVSKLKSLKPYNVNNYVNSLYLRFEVKDKPGVLSEITNRLAKYKISVKRLIQTPDKKNNKATIVIITHKTTETNIHNCLSIFKKNKNILKTPTLIRLLG